MNTIGTFLNLGCVCTMRTAPWIRSRSMMGSPSLRWKASMKQIEARSAPQTEQTKQQNKRKIEI